MIIDQEWLDRRAHLYLNGPRTQYNIARMSPIHFLKIHCSLYIPFKINNKLVNLE